ncbi:LOW QUALITY PROTEIN: hypothetical protein KUTeg_017071 [Tegillarca granosa]|uniref:Uncharacterized protein n=1 Tax=Tegillarca granosa TaxID=220873 RepID=A0ABQ9EQ92_TEGGR|nr:LOW QUALITY PROTEIN: hypothetical protein KUTeg_017071 [Tegillarca granosa]
MCRCSRDRPCDKETGDCPNGCADGFWGPGCQLANACFYNGKARNYMGTKSVTKQLYMCQRWDLQEPHRHSYNVRDFPDEQMPENYCRTTTDSARPWCYTTSKQLRWEHCDTNNCNCPSGRFGNNCMKECHCLDSNEACDSILGICSSGCALGWDGFDCQTAVACPANRYGWDCSKACYCNSPHHCKRFTGPNSDCRCLEGYFNAPRCQPVTPPKIMVFDNIRVNPGQPATFNCTVSAFPTPLETEIQLYGPTKRRITLLRSTTGSNTLDTRINIFRIEYVNTEERYSCVVRATAGEASRTIIANVYDLPRLTQPPFLTEEGIGVNELTIQWKPWARERGDTGDPPILWYNIWVQKFGEKSDKMVGIVTYFNCTHFCKYTVTDLNANTEYGIRIATRRNGKGGDGPLGPPLFAKTACAAPSSAPVDPPNITWNCNNISAYHIYLKNTKFPSAAKAIHLPGDTPGDGSGMKSVSISDLKPSTRYCIQINFQNDILLYSPNSISKCTETPDTTDLKNKSKLLTPTFPRNLKLVTRTNTSLTISWDIPNAEEEVTKYHLAYWKGYWSELATKKGVEIMSTAPHMQYAIENLEPYTKYYIQIQGINSAGPGEMTEALSVMTDEGVPGKIVKFRNTSRTSSSIVLEWGEPEFTNGELQFFTVSCHPVQSLLPGPKKIFLITLSPITHVHTFHELDSATKYQCSVNASTSKGSGPSTTLKVWTLPPEKIRLSNPEIKDKSDFTVTLELQPLDDKAISYYRIIVYKLGFLSKRSIPDSIRDVQIDYHTAEEKRSRAYVAAQINRTYPNREFVVGDNKTYNGFYNAPLSAKYQYEIWFAAYSVVDGYAKLYKDSRPEKYRQYETDCLKLAYKAVINGTSVYKASGQYGVPESTLRDRTRGNVSLDANPGPDRLFSYEEEKELSILNIQHLLAMAIQNQKFSEFAVACKKRNLSETPLSERWFYGFMKRWPDLHLSKPQKLSMIRAKSASKETPQRIYNIDETGLSLEHSPPKIISAKDTKPQACTSSRSSNITIIGGGIAVGNNIPPYYIFPGKRWNDSFLDGTPAGSSGECSESGWSNSSVFHNYMTRHFVKYVTVSKDEPLLVLYDGHKSHIQLTLIERAKKNNIILFVLPPHTSHLTQPLDVGCFGPLKSVYNHECQQFLRKNPGIQITKYEVGQLSGKAYIKSLTPENLASAFRKAGVYPCDKSVITPVDIAPSQIYGKDPQCTTDDSLPANTSVTPGQDNLQNSTSAKIANSCTTSSLTDSNNNSFFEVRKINAVRNRPARKFVPPYLCGNLSKQKNVTILENTAKRQEMKTQNLRKSFAKAERSVDDGDGSVAEAPINSHIPVIIGVLVVFIMLILVFAMLLFVWRRRHLTSERDKADMPNFGPTIIPEPDTSLPSTPVDDLEIEPLIENCCGHDNEFEPIYWCLYYSANDHTRVVLEPVDDDIHDDYTNANYIDVLQSLQ